MANHKSALKRIKQSENRQTLNRWWKSRVRNSAKEVIGAVENKDQPAAATALKKAMSELDKAKSKGVIHKNAAARKKSRLSKLIAKITQA